MSEKETIYRDDVIQEIAKYAMWAGTRSAAGAYNRCLDIIRRAPAANKEDNDTNRRILAGEGLTPIFESEEIYD